MVGVVFIGNLSLCICDSVWSAEVHMPIHIRYHPPNDGAIPAAVNLSAPLMLLSCLPGHGWNKEFDSSDCSRVCDGGSQLEAPCWWNGSIQDCNWQLLPYEASYFVFVSIPEVV